MMVSMAAVGYKLTVRPAPSRIRSVQAGWAALVSSSDEDTKPELSPSTQNYDTDSWPLFEPTALALASTARSRQDDVVFDNSRQPNFCCWLQADIQSLEIEVCSTPKSGHSEAHAGLPFLTQRRPTGDEVYGHRAYRKPVIPPQVAAFSLPRSRSHLSFSQQICRVAKLAPKTTPRVTSP